MDNGQWIMENDFVGNALSRFRQLISPPLPPPLILHGGAIIGTAEGVLYKPDLMRF